jgi:endoglucanase
LELKEFLNNCCDIASPSGYERNLSKYIYDVFNEYCDSVDIDKMYYVNAIKKSSNSQEKSPKIMLAAHCDEIGLIVTNIDKNGFIRFSGIGGIDDRILPAQEVVIHAKKDVLGFIGAKPPHLIADKESKNAPKIEEMYIDTGLEKAEVDKIICIGDTITYKPCFTFMQNNVVSSKSLDNRAGVAVMYEVLKMCKDTKLFCELICTATVQEELGTRGAVIGTYNNNPDIGIAIDVCHGNMSGADKSDTYELGKGPAIAVGPNIHPKLSKRLIEVAKNSNIPYQIDVEEGNTGTDAWPMQISRSGIPTLLVSIPLKYMHTTVETLNLEDIKNSALLIYNFIKNINEYMEDLKC